MSSPTISVTPEHFAAASRVFGHAVADVLAEAVGRQLSAALANSACMAGSDPAGLAWADAYDSAASVAIDAGQDVINACWRFAALLEQTGFNYAGAERASNPHVAWSDPDTTQYGFREIVIGTPPSAAGGSAEPPIGWSLVQHLMNAVWPNGHQDRLHAAAAAWRASAQALEDAAWQTLSADRCITAEMTPESPAAITASRDMQQHIKQVATAHRALAKACDDYAHHLDVVHGQVRDELMDLLEWTAAIEFGGALLSVVTPRHRRRAHPGPRSRAHRQDRDADRRADRSHVRRRRRRAGDLRRGPDRTGRRAAATGHGARSRVVVAELRTARISTALRRDLTGELTEIRSLSATTRMHLPQLVLKAGQIEKKFKHAAALGITAKRGKEGFAEFTQALRDFLAAPTTVRIRGIYRGDRVILNFDPQTRVVVIQELTGELRSAWVMGPDQLRNVLLKGKLGGG